MDLWGWLAVFRRHMVAPFLCVFAGLIGGIYFGYATPKSYESTARVLVNVPSSDELSQALAGAQLTATFVATYANVATSHRVAELAAEQLGGGTGAGNVAGKLRSSVESGTYLIDITARDAHPARAQAIANAAANALTSAVQELQQSRPSSDRITLVILDQAQLPGRAVSPKPKQDVALGLALGVVVGLLVVGLQEALDRTVRSTDQASGSVPAPLLAVVPRYHGRRGLLVSTRPGSPVTESYRTLRTALRFADTAEPPRAILVTGCVHRDGGTSIAVNLAVAFSLTGERVLLVDADLRGSTLDRTLGLPSGGGLAAVLRGSQSLSAAIVGWGDVDVLPAGSRVDNASELLGSPEMGELLDNIRGAYDTVVIDAPPVLPATDATVLSTQVDGVVLVVRAGATPQNAVGEAVRRLSSVGAHLLGQVVNAAPAREVMPFIDRRSDGSLARNGVPDRISDPTAGVR